jgi:hypothetical protein
MKAIVFFLFLLPISHLSGQTSVFNSLVDSSEVIATGKICNKGRLISTEEGVWRYDALCVIEQVFKGELRKQDTIQIEVVFFLSPNSPETAEAKMGALKLNTAYVFFLSTPSFYARETGLKKSTATIYSIEDILLGIQPQTHELTEYITDYLKKGK